MLKKNQETDTAFCCHLLILSYCFIHINFFCYFRLPFTWSENIDLDIFMIKLRFIMSVMHISTCIFTFFFISKRNSVPVLNLVQLLSHLINWICSRSFGCMPKWTWEIWRKYNRTHDISVCWLIDWLIG